MSAHTYARVKANVERHGLRARIPVWQGQKLDGRGLEQICDELGIPESERYAPVWPDGAAVSEEMVADFVMGSKLDRAHWTKGQVKLPGSSAAYAVRPTLYKALAQVMIEMLNEGLDAHVYPKKNRRAIPLLY
jgi:hypothetical protein